MSKTKTEYAETVTVAVLEDPETESDRIERWNWQRLFNDLGFSQDDAGALAAHGVSWHDVDDLLKIGASRDQCIYCVVRGIKAADLERALKAGAPIEIAISLAD